MDARWSFSDKLAVALACLAGVMALVLFWIDKTPLAAGVTVAVMILLMVYPILHLFPSWRGRIPAFAVTFIFIGIFGWRVWPPKTYAIQPNTQVILSPPPLKPPVQQETTINQSATDSQCANQVAQGGSTINCSTNGGRDEKSQGHR